MCFTVCGVQTAGMNFMTRSKRTIRPTCKKRGFFPPHVRFVALLFHCNTYLENL